MRAILRKLPGRAGCPGDPRDAAEPEPCRPRCHRGQGIWPQLRRVAHGGKGNGPEIADVSGIECVGIVKSCPGGEFAVGVKVAALMGGLGRTINGSYAEMTRALVLNVALIEADLPWADARSEIPETYATAWTSLFRNLEIERGQLLCSAGRPPHSARSALKMVVNAGGSVIATTRNRERFAMLEQLGLADCCEIEPPGPVEAIIPRRRKTDACARFGGQQRRARLAGDARRGGRSCLAGWLGGSRSRSPTSTRCLQMPSGVYLTFFGSFVFGTPGFPLSDVPLQQIAADAAAGRPDVKPARVFRFEDIQ